MCMKRKISVSLLALVLGVPAVALLSGAVSLFHESESIVRPPSERRAIAKKLYGAIQVVDSMADYEVRVVDSGADLRVKVVDSGAFSPGLWRFVDSGADYRVKFVDHGADIAIKFVDSGAGL